MDFVSELLAVISSLNSNGVDYVVVGGAALNLHGINRPTQDLDLFIAPTDENIAKLRQALRAVWADPEIDKISTADLLGDYPVVRYGPPNSILYLDILTRLGENTDYAKIEAQMLEVRGVRARVATPQTLYRMKRDTVRAIDKQDAERLRYLFDLKDD